MTIYLIIFLFLLIATLMETLGKKIDATIFLIFTVVVMLLISSIREGIGTDFYNYQDIYNDVTINHLYNVEIGFVGLNYIAQFFGGYKMLLLFVTSINLLSFIYILNRFKLNISLGILTYYSLLFLNHNFNVLRHGIMSALIWIAFCLYLERKKFKSFVMLGVASLFHQSAFIIFPIRYLTNKNINLKISYILLICFYLLGNILNDFFVFANLFISQYNNKLDYYLNEYNGVELVRYKFGIGFWMYVVVYSLLNIYENYFENKFLIVFLKRLLFLALSIICIFASLSVLSERVGNTLLISIVFIFASIDYVKVKLPTKFIILTSIVIIDFFYLMKNLSIPGFNREFQFVPFTYSLPIFN